MSDQSRPPVTYAIDPRLSADLARRFTYHPPKPDQVSRYTMLREEAAALANVVVTLTPPSREQSLALTKIEEAVMWANAAIARNESGE